MPLKPVMDAQYDCAIIGGGVSGLALAILLAREGKKIVLFERETYPFHKVCGEYISKESLPFLQGLGLDFSKWNLPEMTQILMSSPSGISLKTPLEVGGIGLSRYELDQALYQLASAAGVKFHLQTKVMEVESKADGFVLHTAADNVKARVAIGAWGKNSNIDAQLGRTTKTQEKRKLYVAVKHHIRADFDPTCVQMHNFVGGYCGMSAIENGMVNLSYVCQATLLKQHGSIRNLELHQLSKNPFLRRYFETAEFIFPKPLTISHLHFGMKQAVASDILMLGDAAGNIAPLSGNGMSMAFLSAKLAAKAILSYLSGSIPRATMTQQYAREYHQGCAKRVGIARQVHFFFGNPRLTDFGFRILKVFPFLVHGISKRIHGDEF